MEKRLYYVMLLLGLLVLLSVSVTGCGDFNPLGPTDPGPTTVIQPKPTAPAPEPSPAPTPEPTPAPAPTPKPKAWIADTGSEYWLPGQPDRLDGHFSVSWNSQWLVFGDVELSIVQKTNVGIFARIPGLINDPPGYVTINFDSDVHGTWSWNSKEGQAYGELNYK